MKRHAPEFGIQSYASTSEVPRGTLEAREARADLNAAVEAAEKGVWSSCDYFYLSALDRIQRFDLDRTELDLESFRTKLRKLNNAARQNAARGATHERNDND